MQTAMTSIFYLQESLSKLNRSFHQSDMWIINFFCGLQLMQSPNNAFTLHSASVSDLNI